MTISRCGVRTAIYIAEMNLTDLNLDSENPSPASLDAPQDNSALVQAPAKRPSQMGNAALHAETPSTEPVEHDAINEAAIATELSIVVNDSSAEDTSSVEKIAADTAATDLEAEAPAASIPDASTGVFEHPQLSDAVRQAVVESGYKTPSPIQAAIIPPMLSGQDVIAQSQTGSGKTAAFGLPLLSSLRPSSKGKKKRRKNKPPVQALVLTPTRELAQQVAGSLERYAGTDQPPEILAIFGGADYGPQNRALDFGVDVVVGTPGRVIDHIKRGTLVLDQLSTLVLDEADEMLNMGFQDDVEFILQQTPAGRQTALFSATMPEPIRRIADNYLNEPVVVTIESETLTADSIRQRAIFAAPRDKMDLLTRVLEAEDTDAVIIFSKTKESTVTIAERLQRNGHRAVALNGDMPQATRERTVRLLKTNKVDVLVATDVAARGLDVPRISHVINFDLPHDRESYVHRIGRTGRAGRSGEAILFLPPSSRGRLRSIERFTNQRIEIVPWPSADQINQRRIERFETQITETLAERDITLFEGLIRDYVAKTGKPIEQVAAAIAQSQHLHSPFFVPERQGPPIQAQDNRHEDSGRRPPREANGRRDNRKGFQDGPAENMKRYRVEVGREDGVQPRHLVGAIANEGNLNSSQIGHISVSHRFSVVDLPADLSGDTLEAIGRAHVMGRRLKISVDRGPKRGGAPYRSAGQPSGERPPGKPRRGANKRHAGSGSGPQAAHRGPKNGAGSKKRRKAK